MITAALDGESPFEGIQTLRPGAGRAGRRPSTPSQTDEDDTAVILYTSGTTGQPKGAELRHRNMRDNALFGESVFGCDPENPERFLCVLPLFHSFGQTVIQNGAASTGGTVVMLPRFEAGPALQLMQDESITFFAGVPTMYWGLLGALKEAGDSVDVAKIKPTNLRVAAAGGVGAARRGAQGLRGEVRRHHPRGLRALRDLAGRQLLAGRRRRPGRLDRHPDPRRRDEAASSPGPWDEVECRHSDPDAIGEIAIKGHNIMKGYYGRPDATDEAIQDGWFRSGDLGRRDADGWYYIVDRSKDMIIRGGYNVYPREIEEVLMTHPDVSLAAVIGVPAREPRRGDQGGRHPQRRRLGHRGRAGRVGQGARWRATSTRGSSSSSRRLPMTATGKILKRELS